MQHDHVLKKLNFDILTPYPWVLGGGGLRAKYLLPFDMQHIPFLKIWLLTYWPGEGRWGDLRANYKLPCCCISWFRLIWYATWPCSEKVEFWPVDPIPRVVGEGGLRAEYLLPCCCIRDSLKFDIQCGRALKKYFWAKTPSPGSGGGGGRGGGWESASKIFATMLVHFVISFKWICNMRHVLEK